MADEGGGGEDPSSWNRGQDDSVVHGKHLPPSPRRQLNKSSVMAPRTAAPAAAPAAAPPQARGPRPSQLQPHQPNSGRRPGDRYSYSPVMFYKVTPAASSPRSRTTSVSHEGAEPPQTPPPPASTGILRRKVLSKETVKQYQEKALHRQGSRGQRGDPGRTGTCQSSMQVPWERDVSKDGVLGLSLCLGQMGLGQDHGLLEEIDSMCCLGPAATSNLQQVHVSHGEDQSQ